MIKVKPATLFQYEIIILFFEIDVCLKPKNNKLFSPEKSAQVDIRKYPNPIPPKKNPSILNITFILVIYAVKP